jgi:hypothetical protein
MIGPRAARIGRQRNQKVCAIAPCERRRHHADDVEWTAVKRQRCSDNRRVGSKLTLPKVVHQNGNGCVSTWTILVGSKIPPEHWCDAESGQEISGGGYRPDDFRRAVRGQREAAAALRRQLLEAVTLRAPIEEVRVRSGERRPAFFGIALPQSHQARRIAERQRPKHHRIRDREDRRARANSQRQRHRRNQGESRTATERPDTITQVLAHRIQPGPAVASPEHG